MKTIKIASDRHLQIPVYQHEFSEESALVAGLHALLRDDRLLQNDLDQPSREFGSIQIQGGSCCPPPTGFENGCGRVKDGNGLASIFDGTNRSRRRAGGEHAYRNSEGERSECQWYVLVLPAVFACHLNGSIASRFVTTQSSR